MLIVVSNLLFTNIWFSGGLPNSTSAPTFHACARFNWPTLSLAAIRDRVRTCVGTVMIIDLFRVHSPGIRLAGRRVPPPGSLRQVTTPADNDIVSFIALIETSDLCAPAIIRALLLTGLLECTSLRWRGLIVLHVEGSGTDFPAGMLFSFVYQQVSSEFIWLNNLNGMFNFRIYNVMENLILKMSYYHVLMSLIVIIDLALPVALTRGFCSYRKTTSQPT